jgi:hypothetical protein
MFEDYFNEYFTGKDMMKQEKDSKVDYYITR